LLAAGPWFDNVESIALEAIAPRADTRLIDAALSQRRFEARWLRLPEAKDSTMPERGAKPQMVCVELALERGMSGALRDIAERLCEPNSAWLAEPSELFGRTLLLCEDLPPGEQFCAMMDGAGSSTAGAGATSRKLKGRLPRMAITVKIMKRSSRGRPTLYATRDFDVLPVSIGRDATCSIALEDPNKHMSRFHVEIEEESGVYWMVVVSKVNPVMVKGRRYGPGRASCCIREIRSRSRSTRCR
jgi:hypothetical protein